METRVHRGPASGGYAVGELCRRHSFEEVAYLRWYGELPTREQIFVQNRDERALRATAWDIATSISARPLTDHPLDTVRTAVNLLGIGDEPGRALTPAAIRAQALRLFAVLPSVIAMDQRRRNGRGIIAPRDHLGYAANFLYMTFGKVPEPQVVAAFETSLILYTEDSLKSVSLAASPLSDLCSADLCSADLYIADLYSAIATAIDALKDPRRASGDEAVMKMMNEVAIPGNARPWLHEALTDGRKIAGFGHGLGKDPDSRVPAMRAALGMIAALRSGGELLEISDAVAAAIYEVKGLRPNLDFPAALANHLIGFDTSTFTPIRVAASIPGWTAHIARLL